jgi:hypothetical protein
VPGLGWTLVCPKAVQNLISEVELMNNGYDVIGRAKQNTKTLHSPTTRKTYIATQRRDATLYVKLDEVRDMIKEGSNSSIRAFSGLINTPHQPWDNWTPEQRRRTLQVRTTQLSWTPIR